MQLPQFIKVFGEVGDSEASCSEAPTFTLQFLVRCLLLRTLHHLRRQLWPSHLAPLRRRRRRRDEQGTRRRDRDRRRQEEDERGEHGVGEDADVEHELVRGVEGEGAGEGEGQPRGVAVEEEDDAEEWDAFWTHEAHFPAEAVGNHWNILHPTFHFDVFWIEFYEYARRGFPQSTMRDSREKQQKNADGTQNSCQRVDYASDAVDESNLVVNKNAGDAFGPAICHPPVNWSYGQQDSDSFYFFSKGNSNERSVETYEGSPLPELRSMGVEARTNRQTFEEGNLDGFSNSSLRFNRLGANGIDDYLQRYKFPPTLGQYSFYDLNLGLADPLNHDWIEGNYLDPNLTDRNDHNNVKVKIKRHLAVHPSFVVLDGYDVDNKNLAFAPYMESSVNLDYVNAIGDLKTDSKVGGKTSPYGPNSPRTKGRFDKKFANNQELFPRPGFLLENNAEET